jgi:hypothetical protein
MGNEWHDGTPNGGGCGGCIGILTIIVLAVIAGILLS